MSRGCAAIVAEGECTCHRGLGRNETMAPVARLIRTSGDCVHFMWPQKVDRDQFKVTCFPAASSVYLLADQANPTLVFQPEGMNRTAIAVVSPTPSERCFLEIILYFWETDARKKIPHLYFQKILQCGKYLEWTSSHKVLGWSGDISEDANFAKTPLTSQKSVPTESNE